MSVHDRHDDLGEDLRLRAIHMARAGDHPGADLKTVDLSEEDREEVFAIYDPDDENAWVESSIRLTTEEIR